MSRAAAECAEAMSYVRAVARRFRTGHVHSPGDPRVGRVPDYEREEWLRTLDRVRELFGRMPYPTIEDVPVTREEEEGA
jgi:hypothetical protein